MNKLHRIPRIPPFTSQRGAVSIAAALSMTALLGAGAMSVDIGNVMVARNDIQDAVDAGALRGAEMLYTSGSTSPNFSMMTNSANSPVYVAINQNDAIGHHDTLTVDSNYWQSINSNAPSNEPAVRVSMTKQVHLFFGGIIGMSDMNVTATATAIVQNASALGVGGTKLHIAIPQCAINQYWNSQDHQPKSDTIQIGPTHTCNGGSDNSDGNGNSEHQNQNPSDHQPNSQSSLNDVGLPHPASLTIPSPPRTVSPRLVRTDFSDGSGQWRSALARTGQTGRFLRIDQQQNSGADRNGSANLTPGTGQGAGGPGNGSGPGNGAGQGLGPHNTQDNSNSNNSNSSSSSSSSSNSCVTGQFTTLTSHPDDSNFDHAENITKDGNPEDLHVGDSINLSSNDYSPASNTSPNNNNGNSQNNSNNGNSQDNGNSQNNGNNGNSQDNSNQGSQGNHSDQQRQQHHGLLEPDRAILRATFNPPHHFTMPTGYLRVDSSNQNQGDSGSNQNQGDNNSQNQGDNSQKQGDGQQGNGDPYTAINDCSAAGNHSCEYSIVPVVSNPTNNGTGNQTIIGFACLHVLSAMDGTINATLSAGCVSNTTASSSASSSQTAWGVVSPPRLAR